MGVTYSQFFPPAPTLIEQNVPNQAGKVFIVTGGTAGVGYELCKILYGSGGTVHLAGRSKANADKAIAEIRNIPSKTPGKIAFLPVELSDLRTIKPAVEAFQKVESRLDVLVNNAGVSNPPRGSTSAQGYELQMGTNCLGHYLFTQLLLPLLRSTAKQAPEASVRVV
ncbi:hypothetical protein CLAFUW4_06739 [Fulvia fulva]|nr:hypothetical protein CLAFUR4_06747 [Fulvia fulva]KAK4622658.1 hypothetical protein CLAFUR0_06742 [Fulvia fulva]WPV16380.1 hypothetical protein CLAFUW4_06739 [Fulvia fulva]WPV30782.1 hypothetical protein CLAFUW7_06738 [Fulvia fulva]